MGAGQVHTGFLWKDPMITHHLDNRDADQKDNNKTDPENVGWGGIALNALDQDWDSRRAIVNAVMNLRVPQNAGDFLTS
jgi:hypothetical protein